MSDESIQTKLEEWRLILLHAAQLIRERGLTKGRHCDGWSLCAEGAINKADGIDPDSHLSERTQPAWDAVEDELRKRGISLSLSFWNDEPVRTKEEVIELLESVARG